MSKAKKIPEINYDRCVACGSCVQVCPVSCLEMTRSDVDHWQKRYPEMTEDTCIGCGLCAKACPMDTITMVTLQPCA
jgi:formate hydrogenlyase subunit 6/NADH:ubiquinone oxidoreductase subunit I